MTRTTQQRGLRQERARLGSAGTPPSELWLEAAELVPAKVAIEMLGIPRFEPIGERVIERVTATQITLRQRGHAYTPHVRGGLFRGWRKRQAVVRQHIALCMSGGGYRARLMQAIAASGSSGVGIVDPATYWPYYWQADLGHSEPDADPMATGWANQGTGGTAGDLAQSTSAAQPSYDASHTSFNSQAVIVFNDDDMHTSNTFWEQASDGDDLAMYGVARVTDASNTHNYIIGTTAAASNGGLVFGLNAGGVSRFYTYASGGATNIANSFTGCSVNTVHVVTGQLTGAATTSNDTNEVVLDAGTPDTLAGDIAGAVASSGTPSFCIGGQSTSTGNYVGEMAEIGYQVALLTSGEEGDSEAWVNDRYNLSLSGMWG